MNSTTPGLTRRPRAVPLSTRLVVLFGARYAFFGWFFLAFGMVFAWVFAGNADWSSVFLFRGKLETATGKITASDDTKFSEGGSKTRRGTPIYAHHYEFQFNGQKFEGTSYQPGASSRLGQPVTVEFPAGHPPCSRIAGMRRAPFTLAAAFTLIFPAVGLATIVPGLWRGRRHVWLLAHGEPAHGKLIKKEPTRIRVNKQLVYKLTFEFTDAGGMTRQTFVKTERVGRLEDDATESLLYDPRQPSRAVLLDHLPGKQRFYENFMVEPATFGAAAWAIFPPVLALAALVIPIVVKISS